MVKWDLSLNIMYISTFNKSWRRNIGISFKVMYFVETVPFARWLKRLLQIYSRRFGSQHFVNCKTVGVVYLMSSICGGYYIWKTKRPFWVRIKEHVNSIENGNITATVGPHVAHFHRYNPKSLKFFALAHIHPNIRGGSIDSWLLCVEARWISKLRATQCPGLNNGISCKSFLKAD